MNKSEEMLISVRPLLEVRLFAYDFLRCTFIQEPTIEFLTNVKDNITTAEFPFTQESEVIGEGINQIGKYISHNDILSESVCDRLHWDYTRLFVGPYELPAPPWESAYCNEERLLFQKETLEVRKAYLKYFLLPVEFGAEADDHLGLELDFMVRLIELALAETDNKNIGMLKQILTDQKLFLEDHLLRWVPSLCNDIINNAQTEFYQGMAKLTRGFLTLDQKALQELLEVVLHFDL